MAAFDRIESGLPAMDAPLDNIRLGDNVIVVTTHKNFDDLADAFE